MTITKRKQKNGNKTDEIKVESWAYQHNNWRIRNENTTTNKGKEHWNMRNNKWKLIKWENAHEKYENKV